MPHLLYHGHPAADRSVRARMERRAFETFLVIVPTRRRMRHLQRSPLDSGALPAHALQIHTLETLALRMLPRIRPELSLADGILPFLLYQQAIRRAGGSFSYFTPRTGPFPLPQGTFATMVSVLTRLRETGVGPDALEAELPVAEPDEVHKLADVAVMARAYEGLLAARSATDVPGVFHLLANGCSQGRFQDVFREFYPRVDLICAAGFDEFTEPEVGFLTRLRSLERTGLLLAFDVVPGNTSLFGHLEENLERFRALGLRPLDLAHGELHPAVVDSAGRRPPVAEAALARVVRRIFAPADGGAPEDLRAVVTVVSARTRRDEVDTVCRLVKSLLLGPAGREPGRICVAMIDPARYTLLLRHAFARYGIPANITDRFPLARAPVVTGIMGLLRIAARDFQRDDVLRVVSRPEFRRKREGAPLDAPALAAVSGRLKITGGYASWLRRIDRRLAALAADPEGRGEREELDRARADIEHLHAVLLPVSEPLPPAEFPVRLRSLLAGLELIRGILRGTPDGDPLAPERETRAAARFLEVVDDVCGFLAADPDADGAHPLAYYLDQLTVALSAERYNVREEVGRGVLVTAIEETRGLPIDTMILIGLVDGEFPSMYRAEVFYSLERQKLRARRHVWEQRYLFYQAMTNWSDHLYLFHPRQDDGCELVRSTFIDSLLDTARVTAATPEELLPPTRLLARTEALRSVLEHRIAVSSLPEPAGRAAAFLLAAANAERERIADDVPSAYSGRLDDHLSAAARADLERFGSRVYSVSQLETYAACPFRFFGERVLGVEAAEDLVEGLSPLERGSLLHGILYGASLRMRSEGIPALWRADDAQAARAEEILLDEARTRLADMEPPDPFWELDREFLLGGEGNPGLLRGYLASERGRSTNLSPRYFEVAFGAGMPAGAGADPELSQEEPVVIGGVRLRGRIDRVETDGELLAVVDYKTGQARDTLAEVQAGRSLQLPLYLLAAAQMIERRQGRTCRPAAGFQYRLGREIELRVVLASGAWKGRAYEAKSRTRQTVPDDGAFAAVLDAAAGHAAGIVAGIRAGRFPLAPPDLRDSVCRWCPWNTACRVQILRPTSAETEEDA